MITSIESKKVVVVTGAARGLGLAISQSLVTEGYYVVGIGRDASSQFLSLPSESRHFIVFDLRDLNSIKSLAANVVNLVGAPPFALVNNSGVGNDGVLATQHEADIAEVLTVNLHAPILLTKYLSRQMLRKREGRIVNISSIIASTGFKGLAVYGATKAGLEGFTRSLSREVGKAGITVNCVAPGYIRTDMTRALDASKLESVERRAPLGLADPEDVSSAVVYLLGPGAKKITGTVLRVDGGSTA